MAITNRFKSQDYLEFMSSKPCVITKTYNLVDLHHESVTRRFSGSLKKYFDFGVIPLSHDLHLNQRHATGKNVFWFTHNLIPEILVTSYLKEYINLDRQDKYLAEQALELINRVEPI